MIKNVNALTYCNLETLRQFLFFIEKADICKSSLHTDYQIVEKRNHYCILIAKKVQMNLKGIKCQDI